MAERISTHCMSILKTQQDKNRSPQKLDKLSTFNPEQKHSQL